MELIGSLIRYAIFSLIPMSLLGSLLIWQYMTPVAPAPSWIDHPAKVKRYGFRASLFMACFLLPCSFVVMVASLLGRVASIERGFAVLPFVVQQILLPGAVLLLWIWMYRVLAASARSVGMNAECR